MMMLELQIISVDLLVYQNLCCGYSVESSRQDDSTEYPQHRMVKRINWFRKPSLHLIWNTALAGYRTRNHQVMSHLGGASSVQLKSKPVENTVGKGEIAFYEQFLLFLQCFQKTWAGDT